jgi:hypothetical protein
MNEEEEGLFTDTGHRVLHAHGGRGRRGVGAEPQRPGALADLGHIALIPRY